ncbi:hypothetical protein PUMCH_001764 [Australozyma saopauloensis]|uniref:Uncharacterized protein n=1 Tax=Australozyma saopauloensis TaxID=291208 RepID=A0AAX4H7E6_9ASCO|nr:hypothetical protein PUMCH_001764 [[Candida] saopauloensis]
MSGSFWKLSNGFTSLSNVSAILESYDMPVEGDESSSIAETLIKLLDESDLLQELMSNNSLLLEFLRDHRVLTLLVDLLIQESLTGIQLEESLKRLTLEAVSAEKSLSKSSADDDVDVDDDAKSSESELSPLESNEIKEETESSADDNAASSSDSPSETLEERSTRYAALAAEILSADVWSLTDTVMDSTQNLNKLWSILDIDPPLSINLATYFMKIMEHLLDMKCEEMVTYLIDNQPCLVEKFIKHLANPPLMDFLLKLISTDKPDNSTGIIDFLQEQNLIDHLIKALDAAEASEIDAETLLARQSSAADFLKALITISANSTTDNSTIGPNELTRELVSRDIMSSLCDIMLQGGFALGNGVGIIIEIIRKNNSDYDILPVLYITLESHPPTGRDPIYLGHLLSIFGNRIDEFNKLLMRPNPTGPLKTTFGEIEPLGFERFKICELIAELLHCSNMALLNDNKGFDVVRIRDELRKKMKAIDPVSFKYNEIIEMSQSDLEPSLEEEKEINKKFEGQIKRLSKSSNNDTFEDTIDSFNSKIQGRQSDDEEEEIHANANLTEEQIRGNPVIGDYLKIALYDTQIITNILSMFFKFPWNNFLHNVVFDIVQQVLNGSMDIGFNKFLAINTFSSGDITHRITEGQRLCSEYEEEHGGLRLGYMGHLTLIAEEVVKFIQLYPVNTVSPLIDEKIEGETWQEYVNRVLYDTRKKYNAILGGSDVDEDDASNTFDESNGEIIEESDLDGNIHLDPIIDHDLMGGEYEDHDKEEEFREDIDDSRLDVHKDDVKFSSSDESESEDDDDHFASYMSLQLTNSAAGGFVGSHSKNKAFSDKKSFDNIYDRVDYRDLDGGDDEDDDYIDPNDDGMSYKKANSLYDPLGLLMNDLLRRFGGDRDVLSEDSTSSSDSDDEGQLEDNVMESQQNKLTRAASKGS